MTQITFLGASGEVTGSSYLVTGEKGSILIDLGMFQGGELETEQNAKPLLFKPSLLKAVFVTHAHLDHCGRLPLLIYGGYFGKIYMTPPTAALVDIVLRDAVKVGSDDVTKQPLYSVDEVEKTLNMIEPVEYNTPVRIEDFTIMFKDAGHILGSASIEVTQITQGKQKKIVFSGDLGNTPEDIVKPTQYFDIADCVVMETTYGNSLHPKEDASEIIREEITAVEQTGGVLLIPAFSLERTQELLHRIHHLKKDNKIKSDTPVFLDSPMGIHATAVFKSFRDYYNAELRSHTDDPFSFEGLVVTEDMQDSGSINAAYPPKVIIAGSGMMTGGRILHHAKRYLHQKTTRILFIGYQADETLGKRILMGRKDVIIGDTPLHVRAHVREIASMSSHADQKKLFDWLEHIKGVSTVFLTHGEEPQRQTFAQLVMHEAGIPHVFLPEIGEQHNV